MRCRLFHRQNGHDTQRVHRDELYELHNISYLEQPDCGVLVLSEWMANAAALIGSSPITTSPSSFTKIRSDTQIWEKCWERGLSQK